MSTPGSAAQAVAALLVTIATIGALYALAIAGVFG